MYYVITIKIQYVNYLFEFDVLVKDLVILIDVELRSDELCADFSINL